MLYSTGTAEAKKNTATVNNATVNNLTGGYANSQSHMADATTKIASDNTATITNGAVLYAVYGGRTLDSRNAGGTSEASGNTVKISGSHVGSLLAEGLDKLAQEEIEFEARYIQFRDGGLTELEQFDSSVGGNVYGGYAYDTLATANNNTVGISGNTSVTGYIYGGYAGGGTAMANGNAINIGGSMVRDIIYDGNAYGGNLYGGYASGTNFAEASDNIVDIRNGATAKSVYGGYANNTSATGTGATANNNTVTISGGTVQGNVYAGYASSTYSTATAMGNTLTIYGNPAFGTNTTLYGGYIRGNSSSSSSDNTLNLHSRDIRVHALQDFQTLNFFVPITVGNGDVMIYAMNNSTGYANIGNTTVNVGIAGGTTPLRLGDHIVLIRTPNLNGTPNNTTSGGSGMLGVTFHYEFGIETHVGDISPDYDELWAVLKNARINPQIEDLSKGFLTGMSLLNQSGDLVSWHAMSGAMRAAREAKHCGWGLFFDTSGGWSRYNTGCHVDMTGMSLISGAAKYRNLRRGHLTYGAFLEYGNGSYDTYNTFHNAKPVHGNGTVHHLGGGVLSRIDFNRFGSGHFYTEASFRAGRLENGYYNADLRDMRELAASYDAASAYYGLHVGTGKYWHLANRGMLDLYTKYLWTGLQKDSVTLSTGEPVDFQHIESHRLRVGWRFSKGIHRYFSPYLGTAWEYEFDGDAHASTNGFAIDVPTLRGSSGICEMGFSMKPTTAANFARGWYADAGVQGYVGKREGVAANLMVGRNF
jgi:hypothetical protein